MTRLGEFLSNFSLRGAALLGLLLLLASAEALEHGHVRARTRWFDHRGPAESARGGRDNAEMESARETEWTDEALPDESDLDPDYEAWEATHLSQHHAPPVPIVKRLGRTLRRGAELGVGLVMIAPAKKDTRGLGYLVQGPPPMLRFSDEDVVNRRAPSPALPEFNISSTEHFPYLIEKPLPADAMNDPSMLSELVVELEPHTVVSGKIDTSRVVKEERVEHFELDENRSTVLRPEEVLIFFETNGSATSSGAVIPFSPATPSNPPLKSSAKLKKE